MNKVKRQVNLYIRVKLIKLDAEMEGIKDYEPYKFKELGYLTLYKNTDLTRNWQFDGFITVDKLKELIGNQYSKFCQGKRDFVVQKQLINDKWELI